MAKYARAIGYEPYFIAPVGKGMPHADLFTQVFETDRWDEGTIRRYLHKIRGRHPIAALVSQEPVLTPESNLGALVATLAEEMGLPAQNPDAFWRTVNKYLTRDALRAADVRTVDFGLAIDADSAVRHAERIGYPVILKPLSGGCSHLILKCRNAEETVAQYKRALLKLKEGFLSRVFNLYSLPHMYPDKAGEPRKFNPAKHFLIERYIPGREASVECVAIGTEIHALVVHDKVGITERDGTVFEDTLVTPPVRFTPAEIDEMKAYAVDALRAIGLRNSFAHVELRYEDGVGPQILEINPRLGGAYIAQSIETNCGFNPMEKVVDLALGRMSLPDSYPVPNGVYSGFAFFSPRSGKLARVDGVDEVQRLEGVLTAKQEIPTGTQVGGDEEECYVVVCWARGETYEEVMGTYDKARSLIQMEIV